VRFEGRGGEVRLDPAVLAEAHSALLHLVRNAVAHGIEPAADRRAAGKPAEGRVVVQVTGRAGRVTFSCADDGHGFDLDEARHMAHRMGLTVAPGRDGQQQLVNLLLQGGVSTAASVTELSGRGIGMDVVRDVAERLGGDLAVQTQPGHGATVELVVPLSLSSLDALLLDTAGLVAAVPVEAVRRSTRLHPHEVTATGGANIVHDGQVVPLLSLATALTPAGGPQRALAGATTAVVVASATGTVAVEVDRLLGVDTVVVAPLPGLAPASTAVAGVWLDGEGNPRVVLDPDGLVSAARAMDGAASAGRAVGGVAAARHRVLVVDDSLTTRTLERSILESAGYDVDVAASGEEALDKARTRRYALFLVDIEMPGMDGFTLVERTRVDPDLRDVPAILVSSRASFEDRRRGQQVGACLHVDKSEFDQNELLESIARLLGPT
jgi:two-component system chemotaxis sensor kinase CheA